MLLDAGYPQILCPVLQSACTEIRYLIPNMMCFYRWFNDFSSACGVGVVPIPTQGNKGIRKGGSISNIDGVCGRLLLAQFHAFVTKQTMHLIILFLACPIPINGLPTEMLNLSLDGRTKS